MSRDVHFQEEVFPFETSSDSVSPPALKMDLHPALFDDHNSSKSQTMEVSQTGGASNTSAEVLPVTSDSAPSQSPDPVPSQSDTDLGHGRRTKIPSVLLKPYVTYSAQFKKDPIDPIHASPPSHQQSSSKCTYPLTDFLSDHRFSPAQQTFLASVTVNVEPRSYKEAAEIDVWCDSMDSEHGALQDNHTWTVTTLPKGKRAIASMWVYCIKYNPDGTVRRHKSRLVACGNRQKEGMDYKETFAPVIKMATFRIFLGVASARNWELHQMDVQNAFLHGDLEEEVYMKLPPGYETDDPNQVCRLHMYIYGLKQSPSCWFAKLSMALLEFGFVQSVSDYSLFSYTRNVSTLYCLVYVDNLVIGGNNSELITKFKAYLSKCFHMTDLGLLKYFLGLEISRNDSGIYLCQRKYALDIISECGLTGSKPAVTPLEQNHGLATANGELYSDPEKYHRLVGRLVYLVIT